MANERKIPVVTAVDNDTITPMSVSIGSAFESANPDSIYDVHILSSQEFDSENKSLIEILRQNYKRHEITVHISAGFPFTDVFDILPDSEKCIWLSPCTVVKEDLTELFQTGLSDYYMAGVRDASYYWPEDRAKSYMEKLGISSVDQVTDTGVMVLNLLKMRNEYIVDRLETVLTTADDKTKTPLCLLDAINKVCYGRIKIIPFKYNAMSRFQLTDELSYRQNKTLQCAYRLNEWNEGCTFPVILDYEGDVKPWEDLHAEFAPDWWETASRLPLFGEIFMKYADLFFQPAIEDNALRQTQIREREELVRLNAEKETEERIKNTTTFKTGAAVVYIPRKIKGWLKR